MTAETISSRKSWWVTVICGMASYIDASAIVTTAIALVLYQEPFGLGSGQIGQLSAILTAGIAVGALIGGRLGDRFGRRRVFTVTMLLLAAGAALLTFAQGIEMLYAGIIMLGLASGADLPVSLAMITESAPEGQVGRRVGFSHVLWMGGIIVVQAISSFVGGMGIDGARLLYGHVLIASVVVLLLRTTLPESRTWTANREAAAAGVGTEALTLGRLLRSRYLLPLLGVGLFYAITNIAANTNGQFGTYLWVNAAGSDVATSSRWNLVAVVVSIVATLLFMRFVDTRWRIPLFVLGVICSVSAFLIPAIAGVTVTTLIVLAILYSIGGALSGESMYKVWSQEKFPTAYRSTAQGILIAFARFVAAAVGLFTPGIIDAGPSIAMFAIVGTLLLAAAIGLFWVARIPRARDEDVTQSVKTVGIEHR